MIGSTGGGLYGGEDSPSSSSKSAGPATPTPEGCWQPMATAPKDGTHILATNGRNEPTTVHWHVDGWYLSVNLMEAHADYTANWGAPTIWMPLPKLAYGSAAVSPQPEPPYGTVEDLPRQLRVMAKLCVPHGEGEQSFNFAAEALETRLQASASQPPAVPAAQEDAK